MPPDLSSTKQNFVIRGEGDIAVAVATMTYTRRSRYASRSPSPYRRGRSISRSLSRSRSCSRSGDSSDVENPGNNLYVTGLSTRTTKEELEKHFSSEGKVIDAQLLVDPWTKESRGFGFVTMGTIEDADQCIKYLNRSVLEGRVITVAKARRRCGRTRTPGRYLGLRTVHARHHSRSYSPYYRNRYSSPRYSSERNCSFSPYYHRRRSRSYSPYYRRHRSRSYSPYQRRRQSHLRSRSPYCSYSRSPSRRWGHRSYSRDSRSYSSERSVSPYYRKRHYHSISRSISSRKRYSRGVSPRARRRSKRSYSPSFSPGPPRSPRRSYSRSYSPRLRSSRRRSPSCSVSPRSKRYSHESYYHSGRLSSHSRSCSASP